MIEPYVQQKTEVNVRDRVFGSTVLKQQVLLEDLFIHTDKSSRLTTVHMLVWARNYESTETGGYGELIPDTQIAWRPFTLVADNDCVVNLDTGEIFSIRTPNDPLTGKTWDQQMMAHEKPLQYQGNLFQQMMYEQDVRIVPLAIRFILDADSPRVNKFK